MEVCPEGQEMVLKTIAICEEQVMVRLLVLPPRIYARLAKLGDAPDLGSGGRNTLRVRVPYCAPNKSESGEAG